MSAKRRIIPLFIPHLGCPNDCVFCNQKRISGAAAPVTAKDVRDHISHITQNSGSDECYELAFYGGSFTAIPSQEQEGLLGAALPFLHSGKISSVRVSTRPDAIDETVLDRLGRFGVRTIELGAQSMRDEVLIASGRGHTAKDTEKASRLIKEHGFCLILQMMTGLPGDDAEGAVYTARKIAELKPDGVRIYPAVILHDTKMYDMWECGKYSEHTVEDAVEACARIVPIFEAKGIPIIRLGLNPTAELSSGAAAAGAYHPALGELVISRMMLNDARKLLSGTEHGDTVTLGVSPDRVSAMTGQHRENIRALCREFGLKSLKIAPADIEKGKIVMLDIANA
jgi:histone acetyltransferase (RNA polymerase elongator complex component)